MMANKQAAIENKTHFCLYNHKSRNGMYKPNSGATEILLSGIPFEGKKESH